MKKLKDILYKVKISKVVGSTIFDINNISIDSREINSGDLFIAINGVYLNGHEYISKAIENGAIAIVCEYLPDFLKNDIITHILCLLSINYNY